MKEEKVIHSFPAFYRKDSKILILGSFPSVKSREANFYYMHKSNRFWTILGSLYNAPISTLEDKKQLLTNEKIALWDVVQSCVITGSKDESIKEVEPVDIKSLLKKTSIEKIFTTGKKAYNLYYTYLYPITKMEATYLPSTSASNKGNYTIDALIQIYRQYLIEGRK